MKEQNFESICLLMCFLLVAITGLRVHVADKVDTTTPSTYFDHTSSYHDISSLSCAHDQFTCANKRCIRMAYVCDGDNDCGDRSDETNCTFRFPHSETSRPPFTSHPLTTCTAFQFTCTNKKCIRQTYVCDGDNDCGDRSDEADCNHRQPCNMLELHIPHADYSGCHVNTTVRYGSEVTIQCHLGYTLVGSNRVICREHNTWSKVPNCIRTCSTPTLPNAYFPVPFSKYKFQLGDELTYLCNDEYVTFEDNGRTHSRIGCGSDGNWIPENSGCTRKKSHGDIIVMQMERNALVDLTCDVNEETNELTNDYFWLKNSVQLNNNSDEFTIDARGTLIVKQMSENAEGHYNCFSTRPQMKPSNTAYELRLKPLHCPHSKTEAESYTFNEGAAVILTCPHTAKDTQFVWFKNGIPLQMNNDKTLLSDGVLYINTVRESDKGNYACRIIDRESLCERNHSITVEVLGSGISTCGERHETFLHPWIVSLWQRDEIAPFCYGTLIRAKWVITAGHCLESFYRKRKLNLYVQFNKGIGSRKYRSLDVPVKSVKIHPQFLKRQYANDVGLVQLNEPVQYSRYIKPICLTEKQLIQKQRCATKNITVVGWGPLENEKHNPEALLEESMYIPLYCSPGSASSHVCVKKEIGTVTTMAGDSGSPFEVTDRERVHLLGIYSWGNRLNLHGDTDYFTNITYYVPWINKYIADNENEV